MKKPTPKEIEAARKILVASGILDTFWHKDDIKLRALDRGILLSDEKIDGIANLLVKRHDANEGINWTTIDIITDIYLEKN